MAFNWWVLAVFIVWSIYVWRRRVEDAKGKEDKDVAASIVKLEQYIKDLQQSFVDTVALGFLQEIPPGNEFDGLVRLTNQNCKRRNTCFELERAWKINNPKIQNIATMHCAALGNVMRVFHGTSAKAMLSITQQGFRLPDSVFHQEGEKNFRLFFGRMIYFAVEPGNALHYSADHTYVIVADIACGRCWKSERANHRLRPDELWCRGFNSIYSETVSTRGKMYAIPSPSQINPIYVLKFCKVQHETLYNVACDFTSLCRRDFWELPPYEERRHTGLVDYNDRFVCIWDTRPCFRIHCLIVYRHRHSAPPYSHDSIPVLSAMNTYAAALIRKFEVYNLGFAFQYGLMTNPGQRQIHCHLFSSSQQSPKQAKNILSGKFTPPFLKTPKQIIALIRKYGQYDGTDDVAPPFVQPTSSTSSNFASIYM